MSQTPIRASEAHIVFLTNEVHPHHRLPFLNALQQRVRKLTVLTSTAVAKQAWLPHTMDVRGLRSVMVTERGQHPHGFIEALKVAIPVDVLPRLAVLRPDVVLAHDMGARTIQAAMLRALSGRIRFVVMACIAASGYAELRPGLMRRVARKFILRRADAVIANGRSGAACLRRFGFRGANCYYVPYATDTAAFANVPLPSPRADSIRLVYVGQLIPRKGLLEFMERLKSWAAQNPTIRVRWQIVGKGLLYDSLAAISTPSNLEVVLSGPVAYDELPNVYRDADLMVFPSLADEWGQVVTEAMACRLPVLGSVYSQAVEEMVTEGETGWLFRPNDAGDTLAAIDKALATPPGRLAEMGELARERAMACSPDALADRVVNAINDIA